MSYKLSPSDFAYLYEECKHCYYQKVKHGVEQPSKPMPGIFGAINTRIQGGLVGKNLKTLSNNLPDCHIVAQEKFVESKLVPNTSCYIKGKYDLLAQNSNGTYTLIDLKLSQPDEEKIKKYKTQLFSYKFSLENPSNGQGIKVSQMALLVFYPDTVSFVDGIARLDFPPKWLEIPTDEQTFFDFIKEIDTLLTGNLPPETPECKWCQYVKTVKV